MHIFKPVHSIKGLVITDFWDRGGRHCDGVCKLFRNKMLVHENKRILTFEVWIFCRFLDMHGTREKRSI